MFQLVVLVGKTYSPTRVDLISDSKRILLHGNDTYKLGNIAEGQKGNDVVTVHVAPASDTYTQAEELTHMQT